jgi:hypothetical protein
MLDFIVWIFWFIFGAYSFWFFTRAKKLEPLTLDDLVILWKIHRQQAECDVPLSKVKPIMKNHSNEFSGFRCECGYEYLSKRLIVQRHALERNMFISTSMNRTESTSILRT